MPTASVPHCNFRPGRSATHSGLACGRAKRRLRCIVLVLAVCLHVSGWSRQGAVECVSEGRGPRLLRRAVRWRPQLPGPPATLRPSYDVFNAPATQRDNTGAPVSQHQHSTRVYRWPDATRCSEQGNRTSAPTWREAARPGASMQVGRKFEGGWDRTGTISIWQPSQPLSVHLSAYLASAGRLSRAAPTLIELPAGPSMHT